MVKKLGLFTMLVMMAAVSRAEDFAEMVQQMELIKTNQVDYLIAIEDGKDRSTLCGYCHGKDGNSIKPDVPNLASQNAEYILKQFDLFASGERKNYVMEQLSSSIKAQEKIEMALYFAAQPITPQEGVVTSKTGKASYESLCVACHGVDGRGNQELPRLAGQKKAFLVKTLKDFKLGKKSRAKSPMVNIMKGVDASEIEGLADYIATM